MTPPAKSPRQDAKGIEAWAVFDDSSGLRFLCDSEDAASARAAIQPAHRRIVHLTSAPTTASDGRVDELEREVKRLRAELLYAHRSIGYLGHPNCTNRAESVLWQFDHDNDGWTVARFCLNCCPGTIDQQKVSP